ncbi:hypothetical protein UlMin_030426 [Ulmus minor]
MAAFLLPFTLLIIVSKPCFLAAQTNDNGTIKLGSSITAGDGSSPWLSPSGDFALGFQQSPDNKDLYLLSIWFSKVPQKTVIWSAESEKNPAPKGSKLEILADRGLVLNSPQNDQLWNTDPIISQVAFAIFNDTGNFVLANQNSEVIWETFKYPTDTLLPTQVLEEGEVVFSRVSSVNFSRGRFQLSLRSTGNLVLNSINWPSEYTNENYYENGLRTTVVQRIRGSIFILGENNDSFIFSTGKSGLSADYYYRATLNFDGVFTEYSHPKNPKGDDGWSVLWSIPDDICRSPLIRKSSGVCGYNRICRLSAERRPVCECPRGFSLLDANDEYRGCKPNFFQSCEDREELVGKLYDQLLVFSILIFSIMKDIDWPTSDYEVLQPYDADKCTEACLNDCMCAVAILRNNSCWKKKLPLSNGRIDSTVKATAFVKVRKNGFPSEIPSPSQPKNQNALIIAGSVLLGTSVLVNFLLVGGICMGFLLVYQRKSKKSREDKDISRYNLRCFAYEDLSDATDGFKEELGRGSFGIVYKGMLKSTNEIVAVKKLDRAFQDNEKEFKAEVNVIGHTHHKNLVRLLGFCEEGEQRLLVYEFMSKGTLSGILFDDMKPSWKQRIQMALGVARGLLYLHEECITQIIHCDIKPQNILLDEFYNARIADFGLAKLLLMNQSQTNTAIRGTKGYVAPEWFRNMPINVKVDVYSFGVVLLEIICYRRNVDIEMGHDEKAILVFWAYDCYKEGAIEALVENDMEAISDLKTFERFLMVSIWCIQEDLSLRPTMKKVMLMLEGIVQVPVPPNPFLLSFTS